jgi:hypothetical protein
MRCVRVEALRAAGSIAILSSDTMTVHGACSRRDPNVSRCALIRALHNWTIRKATNADCVNAHTDN